MNLEETLQLHALQQKASLGGVGGRFLDQMIEENELPIIKQMCAKVSVQMHDDLESVCSILDISKRRFIEAAVSDALKRAHELINAHGLLEGGQ